VQQGEEVKVKIIEIDPDRRRLSLSLRRVEPGDPVKTIDLGLPGERPQAEVPELGLSEDVFAEGSAAADEPEPEAETEAAPEASVEEPAADEPAAAEEPAADEPTAEASASPDPEDEATSDA
jgi:small subunit ribosomal protein S1